MKSALIENVTQNKAIYAGIPCALILIGAFLHIKKKYPSKAKSSLNSGSSEVDLQAQQKKIDKKLDKLRTMRELYLKTSKQINLKFEEQNYTSILTEESLFDIFERCSDLVDLDELQEIYDTSRKARRSIFSKTLPSTDVKILKNHNRRMSLQSKNSDLIAGNECSKQLHNHGRYVKDGTVALSFAESLSFSMVYYKFVCTFEEQIKYLIEKTQKDFVVFLDLNFDVITESIDYHIGKEESEAFKQQIHDWTLSIREILKYKLKKSTQVVDPTKIQEILHFEIDLLKERKSRIVQTVKRLELTNEDELESLPTFLDCLLSDAVWEKFGIEQEQVSVESMHLSTNKKLEDLTSEFQSITQEIIEEIYQEVREASFQKEDYF